MESITLDVWPHPLTAESRTTRLLPWRSGLTVAHVLALAPPAQPIEDVLFEVDGAPASSDDLLRPGSVLVVRARAGRGLRTVLQLATIIASIYVPGLPAFAGWSAFGRAVLAAGIQIAGQLVTNALVPPRLGRITREDAQRAEPVYSIRGGRNFAHPWSPLQWILGEHLIFPDVTVQYTHVYGRDEHLHAIYDLGLGDLEFDIRDVKIGETQILNFPGIVLKYGLNGGAISRPEGNVHEEAVGVDLDDTDRWAVRATTSGVDRVVVDLIGTIYGVTDSGAFETRQVQIEMAWRTMPTEAAPSPAWSASRIVTLESDSSSPVRLSIVQAVAPGQYEVRLRRRSAITESARARDDVQWTALRGYGRDLGVYTARNRLGIEIPASGQIHGPIDRLSVIARQKIPVWEAGAWTTKYSSNPAWIFRAVALGIWIGSTTDGTRRLLAGAGLPHERVDDQALQRWGAWCDAKGLSCNLVVRNESVRDVLETVAACGRATISWASGRLGVVWDDDDKPVTALITPALIVRHSYRVAWLASHDAADEIRAFFVDSSANYERRELRQRTPVAGDAIRSSANMSLEGITNRTQASAAVSRQAAHQLRRRRHEWEMPIGALPAARGDVVWVAHSLVDGGQTGRLAAISANRNVITLSEHVNLTAGAQIIIALPDGRLYQSASLAAGDEGDAEIRVTPALPAPPPLAEATMGAAGLPVAVLRDSRARASADHRDCPIRRRHCPHQRSRPRIRLRTHFTR